MFNILCSLVAGHVQHSMLSRSKMPVSPPIAGQSPTCHDGFSSSLPLSPCVTPSGPNAVQQLLRNWPASISVRLTYLWSILRFLKRMIVCMCMWTGACVGLFQIRTILTSARGVCIALRPSHCLFSRVCRQRASVFTCVCTGHAEHMNGCQSCRFEAIGCMAV